MDGHLVGSARGDGRFVVTHRNGRCGYWYPTACQVGEHVADGIEVDISGTINFIRVIVPGVGVDHHGEPRVGLSGRGCQGNDLSVEVDILQRLHSYRDRHRIRSC